MLEELADELIGRVRIFARTVIHDVSADKVAV
jgi:hypothetical protein